MTEFKIRPVTRYIVTRYDENGSSVIGEYENADTAYEVGYALAKGEADRLNLPPDSMEVIFPEHPDRALKNIMRL